jgi:magnesium transporter
MNFDVMPELHWEYGYFVVLALIVGACGFLFTFFRRAGWI